MTYHLYLDARVEEETLKKVVLHSVATALASMVLPVPGGPNISTPCICTSPCHMCRLDQPLSHVQTGPALVTCADWTSPCHMCRLDQPLSYLQTGPGSFCSTPKPLTFCSEVTANTEMPAIVLATFGLKRIETHIACLCRRWTLALIG